MPVRAYISLGSNLESPLNQVSTAAQEISQMPCASLVSLSPWYRSSPLGPPGQPDYINGVAEILTTLTAPELLTRLQGIEDQHRRVRTERWGARTLDLDILLYGDQVIESNDLTIPHPEMAKRNFVILPLFDIAPQLTLPNGDPLSRLLANVSTQGIVQLANGE